MVIYKNVKRTQNPFFITLSINTQTSKNQDNVGAGKKIHGSFTYCTTPQHGYKVIKDKKKSTSLKLNRYERKNNGIKTNEK